MEPGIGPGAPLPPVGPGLLQRPRGSPWRSGFCLPARHLGFRGGGPASRPVSSWSGQDRGRLGTDRRATCPSRPSFAAAPLGPGARAVPAVAPLPPPAAPAVRTKSGRLVSVHSPARSCLQQPFPFPFCYPRGGASGRRRGGTSPGLWKQLQALRAKLQARPAASRAKRQPTLGLRGPGGSAMGRPPWAQGVTPGSRD